MTLLIAAFGSIGIPFAIWFVVVAMWLASLWLPQLVPDTGWLPRGRATPVVWGLTGALVIFAGIGLTLWALGTDQMGESTIQLLEAAQDLPGPALATALVVFIVVNAVTEEIAYRGIVFDAAGSVFGPKPAVIAQAIAFGTLHVAGFPAGPVGVGLAFGYGLTLGTVRHLTGGLQFPIIAHMAADTTIAILFVVLLLR
jgi:membrane protease YdiL (CAAX protease family)